MALAEDIAQHVRLFLATAQSGTDTGPLSEVFAQRPESSFATLGDDALRELLARLLSRSDQFQLDLAEVIDWKQPREDSAQLASLAFAMALDKDDLSHPALLDLPFDWKAWRVKPDRETIYRSFDISDALRTGFARIVGAYPGKGNLDRVVDLALGRMKPGAPAGEPVRKILKRHLLNWDEFKEKQQETQFLNSLKEDFTFRQAVAYATSYQSADAKDLACLACDMLRVVPARRLIRRSRGGIIEELKKDPGTTVLGARMDRLRDRPKTADWQAVQKNLASEFSNHPELAPALWKKMNWPFPFALVLREELKQIAAKRPNGDPELADKAVDVSDLAAQMQLTGFAFSGGGIRSATFNLGILQKLAELGLLKKIDYLSTVSGGGYIGAWLAGWIYRERIDVVERGLSPKATPDPRSPLRDPIQFLREYSNYLTPTLGAFSFDTWTMIAVYTRNVLLNQATLFALLATLLLVPRFLALPMNMTTIPQGLTDLWIVFVSIVALVVAVACMSRNMNHATAMADVDGLSQAEMDARPRDPINGFYGTRWVQISVVACMFVAVTFGSIWFWRNMGCTGEPAWEWWREVACFFFVALSALLAIFGGFWNYFGRRYTPKVRLALKLVFTLGLVSLCGGAAFGLLLLYLKIMNWWRDHCPQGAWHAEIWGPVLLLTVLVIPGVLQVGLMGVDFPDSGREWMSRFRGVCTIYTIYWIALLSAAIYGPLLVFWAVPHTKTWISAATAWVGTTVASFLAGSSKKTGDKDKDPTIPWLEVVAKVGPPVFVAGLLIIIATLEQFFLARFGRGVSLHEMSDLGVGYWSALDPHPIFGVHNWLLLECLSGLVIGGLILAWRVDINEFSMHHFYKNRLVRCYLGASHKLRNCNPFTGFDEADDLPLSRLKAIVEDDAVQGTAKSGETPYEGPYPIINSTLNLSAGKQLAWQERKAASFILTPCFCGFDFPHTAAEEPHPVLTTQDQQLKDCAYRPTMGYAQPHGPRLGTAVSISGAAASPNQGYNTSAAVAFLMTMFNVRLGWWVGNPRRDEESILPGPRFGLAALISELLGRTDDEARFINLSDGGHFDNMGIYELVRRRCRFIVLCDAEEDAAYKFGGLGMAIRKCRVDFGAMISIDPSRIVPKPGTGKSESHCAVGTIEYLDGSRGTLVYIKASMTGDEPEDVIEYHATQPHFPHDSTAEQWFEESQFESYRALGYHAAAAALSPSDLWRPWTPESLSVEPLFTGLENYWYPMNPNLRTGATKLTERLAELLQTIEANPGLHELGAQLFPNSGISPTEESNSVEEFYFCLSVIQLVEDVYFEFELDRVEWFHDPRIGGWRCLFRTWKTVPAIASAWAAQRATFREDFQRFWIARIN